MFAGTSLRSVSQYWDARPCNIRHSPRPVGTREYFDEVETRKYFVEPHIPGFAAFPHWSGKRVLEIGCGIGTDTISFARHGAHVTAADISEESLAIARRRASVFGLEERVSFYHADAESLSGFVPVEPYDLVYAFGVIHHTPHPERVLAQLRKYVRPAGTLKIMVYHRWSWKALAILFASGKGRFWKWGRLVAEHSEAQEGCPVTYTFSRSSVRRLVETHGFRVTRIRADHIFPYRIPEYTRYEYKRMWYFRWMPAPLFRAMESLFGWHLCLTAQAQ
jgi:2-polyprenyl-3-methyl-5-hydroxy-6-metoxy-1,4-benzoquinol methylase